MGRKQGYERNRLIARATAVCHANGLARTSAQMLVDALGVNRNSMYSEFGSKQALFEAALQRYDGQVVTSVFESLEAPDAQLRHIEAWFKRFGAAASGPSWGLGCLMCNTAVELGGLEPVGERAVHSYFRRAHAASSTGWVRSPRGSFDRQTDGAR